LNEQTLLGEVEQCFQRVRDDLAADIEPVLKRESGGGVGEDSTAEEVPPELREVFLLEAEDHLRTINSLLPSLDREPVDLALVQDVRRSVHTLKGAAAMVGFGQITRLAHRMEDLLDLIYEGS